MEQSRKKQALLISLRLLAASPKTSQELRKKLQAKGFLSDQAYAMNLLARYRGSSLSGRRKIAFEFKRHGIAKKIQDEILSGYSHEEEREQAESIARDRWNRLVKLPDEKRKKRVMDFLMRRGFEYQIVRDVLQGIAKDT